MNIAVFKEAQEAYSNGDYRGALEGFTACARDTSGLSASDLSKFYHLIGNCYVKSGDPYTAAAFFTKALSGSPEKRKPSLYVNLGTSLLGTKDYDEALSAFTHALDYPVYPTPYKAYSGIGAAQLKLGNMAKAGAAYRSAALDPTNPAPAKALVNLGVCFMELGRAQDAVTTYETALEFDLDDEAKAKAYANIGQAYMAQGRVQRAIDSFEKATAGGTVELSSIAQHDYDLALALKDRLDAKVPGILDTGFIPADVVSELAAQKAAETAGMQSAAPESSEMTPSASGHLPVYGEPGFDPFAPQTIAMEPVSVEGAGDGEGSDAQAGDAAGDATGDAAEVTVRTEAVAADAIDAADAAGVAEAAADGFAAQAQAASFDGSDLLGEDASVDAGPLAAQEAAVAEEGGADADLADLSTADGGQDLAAQPASDKTEAMFPVAAEAAGAAVAAAAPAAAAGAAAAAAEQQGTYPASDSLANTLENANDEFGILARDDSTVDFETTETHMPSPEDTSFFEITEEQIADDAREGRRRKRRARGVGLKVAITLVVLCILVALAACAAYVLGFGYPLQEDVAEDFFAAAQAGEDTSQYWADADESGSHEAQLAVLEGLTSYNVEAVQREMQQSTVYVKGTLAEGGQVDYELVMSRKGTSWAVEYVQLWFASQQ